MAALLSYLEFQFEACPQILLQRHIAFGYYSGIREYSTNQSISTYQSQLTIVMTLTNVWLPQLVGKRQYVSTLKTKVWQFALNLILVLSLLNTLTASFHSRNYGYYYVILFVVLLFACMASTFMLNKNCCKKFEQTERLKLYLLCLLFIVKNAFDCYVLYALVYLGHLTPVYVLLVIQASITICMDIFFAYIFGKSAFKMHSISSIWNMEPTIISKPCFFTGFLLAIFPIVYMLSSIIKGQLISKANCQGRGFSQKTNENTSHSSKKEFIRSFFGRILGFTVSFRN